MWFVFISFQDSLYASHGNRRTEWENAWKYISKCLTVNDIEIASKTCINGKYGQLRKPLGWFSLSNIGTTTLWILFTLWVLLELHSTLECTNDLSLHPSPSRLSQFFLPSDSRFFFFLHISTINSFLWRTHEKIFFSSNVFHCRFITWSKWREGKYSCLLILSYAATPKTPVCFSVLLNDFTCESEHRSSFSQINPKPIVGTHSVTALSSLCNWWMEWMDGVHRE